MSFFLQNKNAFLLPTQSRVPKMQKTGLMHKCNKE